MIPPRALFVVMAAAALAIGPGCSSGFGVVRGHRRLTVELQDADKVTGNRFATLPLAIDKPQRFRIIVRALDDLGNPDASFDGFVRLSAKPGAIQPLSGPDTEGRNVRLVHGESRAVDVDLANAYGTTYILADDLGYEPADPLGDPAPACSNGQDDDGDGLIDFPADDGCAFANDNSEQGGAYATGASPPIFYALPRIADVRGLRCEPTCAGAGATPYPKQQVQIDTGYHDLADGTQRFDFNVVVSRISSSGFYATDVDDSRGGFTSLFAFNFSAPPQMRVCDRLKSFGGTSSEFFGFTQISYPTWTLEEWDPRARRCLVPDPTILSPTDVNDATGLLGLSGGYVRVRTTPQKDPKDPNSRDFVVMVTPKFGPGNMPKAAAGYTPAPDATNCDFNKDGKIDFAPGSEEGACNNACDADKECTEYSNYAARSTFRLTVRDANKQIGAIQADATTSATFDPVAMKGKPLGAFSGTMTYFSGGSQFTIEARCSDDIVVDLDVPPLGQDSPCKVDGDCAAFGPSYKCLPLSGGDKACRTPPTDDGGGFAPPSLACVFPRTILDTNPQ